MVTEQDLIEAILASSNKEDDANMGVTSQEVANALGVGIRKARSLLGKLKAEGRLEVVKVRRKALNDVVCSVDGYRLK